MANRWRNKGNSERLYFWAPKSLQMVLQDTIYIKNLKWYNSWRRKESGDFQGLEGEKRRHINQSVQSVNYARCVILTILLYTVGAIVNDTVLYSGGRDRFRVCITQAEKWEGSLDINQEHIKVCEMGRIQWTYPENKSPGCTQWPCTLRRRAGCSLHE